MYPGGAVRGKLLVFGGQIFLAMQTSHFMGRDVAGKGPWSCVFQVWDPGQALLLGLKVALLSTVCGREGQPTNGRQELQFVTEETIFNIK